MTPWPPIASCWLRVTTTHWHNGGVRIHDLADRGLRRIRAGSALRHIIDGKLRDGGVEVNVVMELRSIPAILRMVSTARQPGVRQSAGFGRNRARRCRLVVPVRACVSNAACCADLIARRGFHRTIAGRRGLHMARLR